VPHFQELSHYVNEVKRDSEMLVTINKVSACLTDYTSVSYSAYATLIWLRCFTVETLCDVSSSLGPHLTLAGLVTDNSQF